MKTKQEILNEALSEHGIQDVVAYHPTLRIAVLKAMEEYRNQPPKSAGVKVVIIYEVLQRERAMLGYELIPSSSMNSSHVGQRTHTTHKFVCGAEMFFGDYRSMPFNSKNCLMFRKIFTDKEAYDKDKNQ